MRKNLFGCSSPDVTPCVIDYQPPRGDTLVPQSDGSVLIEPVKPLAPKAKASAYRLESLLSNGIELKDMSEFKLPKTLESAAFDADSFASRLDAKLTAKSTSAPSIQSTPAPGSDASTQSSEN